jgi:hypothetical protein
MVRSLIRTIAHAESGWDEAHAAWQVAEPSRNDAIVADGVSLGRLQRTPIPVGVVAMTQAMTKPTTTKTTRLGGAWTGAREV